MYSFKDKRTKKIVHAIKYFHRKDLIEPLVSHCVKIIRQDTSYVLIPIPMPALRKYTRGYNHTEALAEALGKKLSLRVQKNILLRNSDTSKKRQVQTRSRGERLRNQHNAFRVATSVSGMNIILVDDVTTTGATLLEARKVLLQSGASSVEAFTVAH